MMQSPLLSTRLNGGGHDGVSILVDERDRDQCAFCIGTYGSDSSEDLCVKHRLLLLYRYWCFRHDQYATCHHILFLSTRVCH